MAKEFANDLERLSYALGMNMGEHVATLPMHVDPQMVLDGFTDFLTSKPALSPDDYGKSMRELQQKLQEAAKEHAAKAAEKNIAAEKEFLAANKAKEGVKETASGLQYEVLSEGNGAKPGPTTKVRERKISQRSSSAIADILTIPSAPGRILHHIWDGQTNTLFLMNWIK